ncbi:MAG: arsenite S-adenosylmethyltransferase [Bacteroidetes bacterium RIFCSPLOWO2_12_FULL_35_15]|nr:MAG: arsenite S-adenosylmethyltransferase [Bacteroidetes bacterium RIFCSPLOWO2_12_FULL_35_15]
MENSEKLKQIVKEKYSEIALQTKQQNETSCCGAGNSCGVDYTIFSEDYSKLEGYDPNADLGLGCGLPTEFALIKKGDVVIDLGSGAGNDCFVARAIAGETGKIIGIDMTEAMINKARENADKLGFNNVEFRLGEIEKMPLTSNVADVVVSNCVLNLVPNKVNAFKEIYRVLKPGGHFSISDVVLIGELPDGLKQDAEMYAGCVSGAIQKSEYLNIIKESGFENSTVQKDKAISIPDELLKNYLSGKELADYKNGVFGIFSITVYADKPKVQSCCTPGSGCC